MKISKSVLEKKFLYRLIKTVYNLSLIILILIALIIVFLSKKPTSYIDNTKSTINCVPISKPDYGLDLTNTQEVQAFRNFAINTKGLDPNGVDAYIATKSAAINNSRKKYTLEDSHIYLYSKTDSLTRDEDITARKLCAYAIIGDNTNQYKTPTDVNYELNLIESIQGSWGAVILWSLITTVLIYSGLNIIKETLYYVFFGKDLSWEWLAKLIS